MLVNENENMESEEELVDAQEIMGRKHDSAINDNYDERLASDMTVQEMLALAYKKYTQREVEIFDSYIQTLSIVDTANDLNMTCDDVQVTVLKIKDTIVKVMHDMHFEVG
jgi:hypothetical protein